MWNSITIPLILINYFTTYPFPFLSTPTICLLYHSVPHKHITFRSLWPPIFSDGQTREQTPSTRHFCFLIWTRIARGRYSGTLALLCHICRVYYHVPCTFARNSTFIKALTNSLWLIFVKGKTPCIIFFGVEVEKSITMTWMWWGCVFACLI